MKNARKYIWIALIAIILIVVIIFYPAKQISSPCIQAGESIPLPANGEFTCCEGLRTISPAFPSDDLRNHISSLPEGCDISVGPTPICANCGDGECREGENRCNCPEDCSTRSEERRVG